MPIITFEGAVGVGKTTAMKYFAEKHKLPYEEEKINTPILDMFMKDPLRWSFTIQIHFLNTRLRDIKKLYEHDIALLDRSIYCDLLFARINAEMGRMSSEELKLYESLFYNLMGNKVNDNQDLMVYLQADFDTVFDRMLGRARKEEMDSLSGNYEYFKYLHSCYDDFILNEYNASPVLLVDTTDINIHNDADRSKVFEVIEFKLGDMGVL